jgi:hypothetical protein
MDESRKREKRFPLDLRQIVWREAYLRMRAQDRVVAEPLHSSDKDPTERYFDVDRLGVPIAREMLEDEIAAMVSAQYPSDVSHRSRLPAPRRPQQHKRCPRNAAVYVLVHGLERILPSDEASEFAVREAAVRRDLIQVYVEWECLGHLAAQVAKDAVDKAGFIGELPHRKSGLSNLASQRSDGTIR